MFGAAGVAQESSAPAPVEKAARVSLRELSLSLERLTESVRPAVVQVFTTGYAPLGEDNSDGSPTSLLNKQRATGSGVLLSADGYIITNSHVVENGRRIQVKIASSKEAQQGRTSVIKPEGKTVLATVVGVDRESDLAVLKIEAKGLPFLQLGDSDALRQGQLVMAFGNPLGLESSVSMGVVSSVARQIKPDDPMVYVQTDAPINPGNSGGPLIDSEGRVMGINTFILSQSGGSEGIGFAVPSNIVHSIFDQIRKDGHVHRGQIGVFAQSITPLMAQGLKLAQDDGVIVADVEPDGPADKAGVQVGDIVTALNGKPMENARQLEVNVYRQLVTMKVTLDILRDGKPLKLTVPVVEREDDPMRFIDLADPRQNLIPKLGILAIPVTQELAKMLSELRFEHGVIVAARSSEAAANGLKPGDVIYALNRTPIVGVKSLQAAIDQVKPGEPVVLQMQRGSRVMFLTIELE
jgi:serine protease Do